MKTLVAVEGQTLRWYGKRPELADNSIQFVQFQFNLPKDWAELEVVAQFSQTKTYNKLLENGCCYLPAELDAGMCDLSLFGQKAGQTVRATTIPLRFKISRSGFTSTAETPIPPTPDLYAQLLERISEGGTGNLDPAVVAKAVEDYLKENPPSGGVQFETDSTLSLEGGVLSVNTADKAEADNTLPITSAAVYAQVGNIDAILETI